MWAILLDGHILSMGGDALSGFMQPVVCKRNSTGAQYVILNNKIKCLSLAVLFLATPPIKL
jgi:hypothetical protein